MSVEVPIYRARSKYHALSQVTMSVPIQFSPIESLFASTFPCGSSSWHSSFHSSFVNGFGHFPSLSSFTLCDQTSVISPLLHYRLVSLPYCFLMLRSWFCLYSFFHLFFSGTASPDIHWHDQYRNECMKKPALSEREHSLTYNWELTLREFVSRSSHFF